VVQDVADFGAVGDEGNDAHLPTAHGAQQRKCLVDARLIGAPGSGVEGVGGGAALPGAATPGTRPPGCAVSTVAGCTGCSIALELLGGCCSIALELLLLRLLKALDPGFPLKRHINYKLICMYFVVS
jgi:hypothetical protein